jgi:hypothetical protein
MAKEKTLEILAHILGWLTGFIGPLIIFLTTKDAAVKKHAKNALNWQFSLLIYVLLSMLLTLLIVGFVLLIALSIMNIVFCIIAAVKAGEDELWEYPLSIKFFRV